jgi:uncharacterized protein YndB with AHSA1/START domain
MAERTIDSGSEKTKFTSDGRMLRVERTFDAPRELVFKAFTEPDRIAQWWGPRGWQTTNYRMDVRPGGQWHYCMRGPDGMESWGIATYREIVEPERIVYVDSFSDAEGNVSENMPSMLISMEFLDDSGRTRLLSHTEFASPEALQSVIDMGMVEGLTETWDRLEEYLAAQGAAPTA